MKTDKISFAKFHGLGNDFIISRGRGLPRNLPALARAITNRHTGVGADGFLVVLPPKHRRHDAWVRFFNADGSEPEVSGNGLRCVGAYLAGESERRQFVIETAAGVKSLRLLKSDGGHWVFEVAMGEPILATEKIPFAAKHVAAPVVNFPLPLSRGEVRVTVTSMGNPHCTVFVDDFDVVDWRALGREIEKHRLFPNRTNVEFVKVISRREIAVRFWERGVGETNSSGTGSCGAAVACILNSLTGRKVRVRTLAGNLKIAWPENGEVTLTGPAKRIAEGTFHY